MLKTDTSVGLASYLAMGYIIARLVLLALGQDVASDNLATVDAMMMVLVGGRMYQAAQASK